MNRNRLPLSRFWISQAEVKERISDRKILFGFADVTSSTNERSMLATIIPLAGVGHTMPLILTSEYSILNGALLSNLNSFCFDYLGRQKLGGLHYTYFILKQLAVLPSTTYSNACTWVCSDRTLSFWFAVRVLELVCTASDLEPYSEECGYNGPPFIWNEERRFEIRCELDAAFFHLYGIDNEDDVDYIMETFPIVKRKDEKHYGTYRTKNRILEIYREMAKCMEAAGDPALAFKSQVSSFKSRLTPPPGPPVDAEGNFIPMSEWDPNNWPSHIHRLKEEGDG